MESADDKDSPKKLPQHAHIIQKDAYYREILQTSIISSLFKKYGLLRASTAKINLASKSIDSVLEQLFKGIVPGNFEIRYYPVIGNDPLGMALGGSSYKIDYSSVALISAHELLKKSRWDGGYYPSKFTIESDIIMQISQKDNYSFVDEQPFSEHFDEKDYYFTQAKEFFSRRHDVYYAGYWLQKNGFLKSFWHKETWIEKLSLKITFIPRIWGNGADVTVQIGEYQIYATLDATFQTVYEKYFKNLEYASKSSQIVK